ncbi:CD109 antigen-like [Musca vetustissima]|uniref:CD109 antigen-like n=1 Tax=Musca vetustissima TaxID=27455 RepID=UPI002AB734C6|nr:CD109 antigen-like [Musca vetustissima]
MVRGEVVKIPVTIFNYHNRELNTMVTMNNSNGEYDFVDEATMKQLSTIENSQRINVPANSGKTLKFSIKPKKLGPIKIQINATNNLFKDAILQDLLVEPKGKIERQNKDLFISLNKEQQIYRTSIDVEIPQNIVPDTEFIQLSVGSDILYTALDNLDNLVQLPAGCAEQNMMNFAPNVLVLDHLRTMRKSSEKRELDERATRHIEIGYQQELTYRHVNGAYSVFGPKARTEENTWLTAYIIRFFIKAQRYVGIESSIINEGLEFLKSKQLPTGEFQYTDYLFHPAHQDRYGFTAFVLLPFLESSLSRRKYKAVIDKGVEFLVDNINNIDDNYALSLTALALQMSKNDYSNELLTKLQEKSLSENAYAVMAFLESNSVDNINIMKWILEQRSKVGGFKTSQDTVVALQALIKFNEKYTSSDETLLKVSYEALDDKGLKVIDGFLGIDPSNTQIWQQIELPIATRLLQLKVEGQGNAIVQLAYHYYMH